MCSSGSTHIGTWARENQVGMDKLYVAEHREGGTRALGAGIPVPKAEALRVFNSEEWPRQRDLLIHERWLEKARAQLASPPAR